MFDNDPLTYYHSGWNGPGNPEVKIYFGYETEVSKVKVIFRLDNYCKNAMGTEVSVLQNTEVESKQLCGTIASTKDSSNVEDQTHSISCGNKKGYGVVIQRNSFVNQWCPAEVVVTRDLTSKLISCSFFVA